MALDAKMRENRMEGTPLSRVQNGSNRTNLHPLIYRPPTNTNKIRNNSRFKHTSSDVTSIDLTSMSVSIKIYGAILNLNLIKTSGFFSHGALHKTQTLTEIYQQPMMGHQKKGDIPGSKIWVSFWVSIR